MPNRTNRILLLSMMHGLACKRAGSQSDRCMDGWRTGMQKAGLTENTELRPSAVTLRQVGYNAVVGHQQVDGPLLQHVGIQRLLEFQSEFLQASVEQRGAWDDGLVGNVYGVSLSLGHLLGGHAWLRGRLVNEAVQPQPLQYTKQHKPGHHMFLGWQPKPGFFVSSVPVQCQ
jgi:hypothetical protein